MSIRIGVDTGGTFTDFVIWDSDSGQLNVFKVASTPEDPSKAILEGIRRLSRLGIHPDRVRFFGHGTTVATNALLEGKGTVTGLLITKGFRGVYEVRDQSRGAGAELYDLQFTKPPMLVRPFLTEEVEERIGAAGQVLVSMDDRVARAAVARLVDKGVQSFAVCLLFSFLNPAHERRLKEVIQELCPDATVSLSSEVLPQIREYFRLSTTVVNAYVAPVLGRYLAHAERELVEAGVRTPQLYVMQSNGGVVSFRTAAERAVTTILSGPAAGVMAARAIGQQAGYADIISLDMGGTSCDISLIHEGRVLETRLSTIAGQDITLPMVDVHTIGAGGGSVAWIDRAGLLQVGPRSAGAWPGPACYDQGGEEPTVTDANLVLGLLGEEGLAGGERRLSRVKAEQAIVRKVAEPLGLSLEEAALGIIRIVNVNMEQAIRRVSSERGFDPRRFALVAFGGAGPLHAPVLAGYLNIPTVIIPPYPGVTSALGLLCSDIRRDYLLSRVWSLATMSSSDAMSIFEGLSRRALSELEREGFTKSEVVLEWILECRYKGQGYELPVHAKPEEISRGDWEFIIDRFHEEHERTFGHRAASQPVEAVTFRVVAIAHVPKFSPKPQERVRSEAGAVPVTWRTVWFPGEKVPARCPVYRRSEVQPGWELRGPAILHQEDSTVAIYPGQLALVDEYSNLIISVAKGAVQSVVAEYNQA